MSEYIEEERVRLKASIAAFDEALAVLHANTWCVRSPTCDCCVNAVGVRHGLIYLREQCQEALGRIQ